MFEPLNAARQTHLLESSLRKVLCKRERGPHVIMRALEEITSPSSSRAPVSAPETYAQSIRPCALAPGSHPRLFPLCASCLSAQLDRWRVEAQGESPEAGEETCIQAASQRDGGGRGPLSGQCQGWGLGRPGGNHTGVSPKENKRWTLAWGESGPFRKGEWALRPSTRRTI